MTWNKHLDQDDKMDLTLWIREALRPELRYHSAFTAPVHDNEET
jgi:hypothetical protein